MVTLLFSIIVLDGPENFFSPSHFTHHPLSQLAIVDRTGHLDFVYISFLALHFLLLFLAFNCHFLPSITTTLRIHQDHVDLIIDTRHTSFARPEPISNDIPRNTFGTSVNGSNMAPTDPPRRGRAGRGMTLPRGGRGRRGGPSVNTPTSEAPTAVMTPITPAAAFPELSIEPPGSARTESSVLDTPVSQTATTPTVSTSMPIGSTAGIAARRARAGLRGAVGARRSVVAPRYRGRRTAEERAALAQAERERFGAELAEKEREARDAARERGRGRGKDRGGVRGRDSHQGRGNRESRWSRGGRGGALQSMLNCLYSSFLIDFF